MQLTPNEPQPAIVIENGIHRVVNNFADKVALQNNGAQHLPVSHNGSNSAKTIASSPYVVQ